MDAVLENRAYIQYAVILLLAAFGFWRGAGPEKLIGSILSIQVLAVFAYTTFSPPSEFREFESLNPVYLTIDIAALAAMGAVATFANRVYPIWILGAQLVSVLMHINRKLSDQIGEIGYYLLVVAPSYVQIVAFLTGLILHRRRIAQFGRYRSW